MTVFAGFNWPKRVWNLPTGDLAIRKTATKLGLLNYYRLLEVNPTRGIFELKSLDMEVLYANEYYGRGHVYKADDWSGYSIVGVVMVLPKRRGYLAGYAYNTYGTFEYQIYDNLADAMRDADSHAFSACDREVEFQQQLEWEGEDNETEEV